MVEVIGLAASIAGLVTITAQITSMSCKYVTGVKQAPKEIAELMGELNSLNKILTALKDTADKNPDLATLRELNENPNNTGVGPLQGCLDTLESLKSTLEKSERSLRRKILHRLKWPLKQEETQQYIRRIEAQRSHFTTAVNIDHLSLSTGIKTSVENTELVVRNLQTEAKAEKITRSAEERAEKRDKVLHWLHPDSTDTKHTQVTSKRHKNTGGWILKTPEFREFEKPSSLASKLRLLWGNGIPGAGKTFLCSLAIDHLLDQAASKNYGVAYVYFDFKERDKQTPMYTLASLVKQLGSQIGTLPAELEELHGKCTSGPGRTSPTFEQLYNTLVATFKSFDQVFLVFDALDECHQNDQRTGLLKLFHRMGGDKANVFVTSRHHPGDIQESFLNVPKIELSAQREDIATYIRQTIDEYPQAKRLITQAKCQEQIISDLTGCAHGMFLLVRFHIEYLCQQTTGRQIQDALKKLKASSTEEMPLDDTYHRAIETIRKQPAVRADLGIDVLSWLVKAKRPLTTDELRVAVSVEPGRYELDELDLLVDMATLLDVCAGLTMIDKKSNTVRLVHYTVQEYILKNQITPDAEFTLARTCTTFLSFDIFAGHCVDGASFRTRVESHPFLLYATTYLGHHLSMCDETLSVGMVLKFVESACISSYNQVYYYSNQRYTFGYYYNLFNPLGYPKDRSPLHLASALGHLLVSQTLIGRGDGIPAQDKDGQTALHIAARYDKDAVAKLLIENGADLSVQDKYGRTALHMAVNYRCDAVAKLLIENGADLSVQDKDGQTTLHLVIYGDHDAVAKLLIENGADLSVQDKDGRTALHMAVNYRCDAVAKLLIENGADLSVQDKDGQTTLYMAAKHGRDAVAKLLIENGADLSVQDKDGRTALHIAARYDKDAVVKLLIENGADLSVQDNDGQTALHKAAKHGRDAVAKLLIENGADLSSQEVHGWTALHLAAANNSNVVLELLLEGGADISLKNNKGETPLDCAGVFSGEPSEIIGIFQATLDKMNSQKNN